MSAKLIKDPSFDEAILDYKLIPQKFMMQFLGCKYDKNGETSDYNLIFLWV